jgi:lysine 2,3-aminomutase
MTDWSGAARYTVERFRQEADELLAPIRRCRDLNGARYRLYDRISDHQYDSAIEDRSRIPLDERVVVRDSARALRAMLRESADTRAGFSVAHVLWDIARGVSRPELGPGFYAELIHLFRGVQARNALRTPSDLNLDPRLAGREAALVRSRELDVLWGRVSGVMGRYPDGLGDEARARRQQRRRRLLAVLGGREHDWNNWRWQVAHVMRDAAQLARVVPLRDDEERGVREAVAHGLPFGVTPYYASLMDEDPEAGRDQALRAQVLPPLDYVAELAAHHGERERAFDFMLERDTSPIDLVTRRYPAIAILKPFNTCPQICVYCQRNWEIDDVLAPHALAPPDVIEAACAWIEQHPAIHEVLLTGGDPLTLADASLERLLTRLARIPSVDLIRVGSRIPATMPMRITDALASLLGGVREPGRREVCLTTHIEHPYELTPELVTAVDRLRRQGIAVYNQHVYTFFCSRRFEAAKLRLVARRAGIDPYYTFVPKGKEETRSYRVPLARILQEQKEEARLLPGVRRTDEAVYNVPGLGKNYVRAFQHRDLVSVLPDGSRLYEFHPWEKMVTRREAHVGRDVPILEYLMRLYRHGEDPDDYSSIWYYF